MASTQAMDGTGFKQDAQRLGQGVDTLRADVSNVAHSAADAARSGVSELRHGAQHAVETARKAAVDAGASMKDVIAKNPVATIGIAAGLGLMIGLFVSRRKG